MPNSILKKLSKPNISADEICYLLEKHVGNYENEYICKCALQALTRLKSSDQKILIKVMAKLNVHNDRYCNFIRSVIGSIKLNKTTT